VEFIACIEGELTSFALYDQYRRTPSDNTCLTLYVD